MGNIRHQKFIETLAGPLPGDTGGIVRMHWKQTLATLEDTGYLVVDLHGALDLGAAELFAQDHPGVPWDDNSDDVDDEVRDAYRARLTAVLDAIRRGG